MTATRSVPTTRQDPVDIVADALATTGPLTAAALAAHLGVAYSTITPRLRRLETDHRAERVREDITGRTLWRATPTGHTPATPTVSDGDGAASPADRAVPHAGDAAADGHDNSGGGDVSATSEPDSHASTTPVLTTVSTSDDPVTDAPHLDAEGPPAGGGPPPDAVPAPDNDDDPDRTPQRRRAKGSIAHDILGVLRTRPDDTFKVAQLSSVLGGTSAGAIANALHKLVVDGSVTQVSEKPATYQAA